MNTCAECGIDFYATPPGDSEGAEVTERTDTYGKRVAVNPATIARITEASASSQRHGARSLIHLLDGTFLEVNEGCDRVLVKLAKMGAQ